MAGFVAPLPTIGGKQKSTSSVTRHLFKGFKTLTKICAVLIFATIGGVLNRIKGGYLNFPENPDSSDFVVDILVHDLLARLVIFSIPTGLLVGVLCKEKKKRDPYYFRRVLLFVMVTLLTWFAMYVSSATYRLLGRDSNADADSMGLFDWILGRNCKDYGFWRRWTREIIGMTLLGLLETSPAGLWLFFYGYSADYFFCGAMMGAIFEIAEDIPSEIEGFRSGVELGEFLWGTWIWFVLLSSILTHRKNPRKTLQRKYRILRLSFYAVLGLIELIFVGSCIGYSFVKQHDVLGRDQTLLGVLVITVVLVITQLVYMVTIPIIGTRRRNSEFLWYFGEGEKPPKTDYGSIEAFGESATDLSAGEGLSVQEETASVVRERGFVSMMLLFTVPRGSKPYRFILLMIRVSTIVTLIALIPLLLYVVIADGLLHPCRVHMGGN